MKKLILFSIKVLLFGMILPFKIWIFSKEKLITKADTNSITDLLDTDYIATSWFDWMIDAIIFIMYPIGLLIVIMFAIFGIDVLYKKFIFLLIASIVLYFITLIISFARELGGSFMLLHLNVQKIRNLLKENESESK